MFLKQRVLDIWVSNTNMAELQTFYFHSYCKKLCSLALSLSLEVITWLKNCWPAWQSLLLFITLILNYFLEQINNKTCNPCFLIFILFTTSLLEILKYFCYQNWNPWQRTLCQINSLIDLMTGDLISRNGGHADFNFNGKLQLIRQTVDCNKYRVCHFYCTNSKICFI